MFTVIKVIIGIGLFVWINLLDDPMSRMALLILLIGWAGYEFEKGLRKV